MKNDQWINFQTRAQMHFSGGGRIKNNCAILKIRENSILIPYHRKRSIHPSPYLPQAYAPIILFPSVVTDTTLLTLSTISMTALGESAPI
jgi:hypothetical protein